VLFGVRYTLASRILEKFELTWGTSGFDVSASLVGHVKHLIDASSDDIRHRVGKFIIAIFRRIAAPFSVTVSMFITMVVHGFVPHHTTSLTGGPAHSV
jgi:alpha-D-ribose 1-methylphosphonate 5-phosphate C-P lyase